MTYFVGYTNVKLKNSDGLTSSMIVMYPTSSPSQIEQIGPYELDVSFNANPYKRLSAPLVLISHGTGGSNLVYRDLAHYLAKNGFIVGLPEHPGNNRNDNSLEGTVKNLIIRPQLISIAIDWFLQESQFTDLINKNSIFMIGHSLGGYTALAVAGGEPINITDKTDSSVSEKISVQHDDRVKALVLLTPAAVWFREPGSLMNIKVPILMYVGEEDEYTGPKCPILLSSKHAANFLPYGYHANLIMDGVSDKAQITFKFIKNAGHFSFLSPFPKQITRSTFPPSQDPPGFNRHEFQKQLNQEILNFFSNFI